MATATATAKELCTLPVFILRHFCCSVVTYQTFSCNICNFWKNEKKSPKIQKSRKISKNLQKFQNILKIQNITKKIQKTNKMVEQSKKNLKNQFFSSKILKIRKIYFFWPNKCYSPSFPNWGDYSLTRALQSTTLQNPGVSLIWALRKTEILSSSGKSGTHIYTLLSPVVLFWCWA